MLDIRQIRENPEKFRKDLQKRRDEAKIALFDDLLQKDKEYRQALARSEQLRRERNDVTSAISELRKHQKDPKNEFVKAKEIASQLKKVEATLEELKQATHDMLLQLPNLTHESVPYGKDDTENVEVRSWGKKSTKDIKNHAELAETLGIADFEKAAITSGKGFYYLKGGLALLNQALIRYAVDTLIKKGFTYVEPPYLISRKVIDGVTDFQTFQDSVYKIEGEDLHLISTSEHPLVGMYMNTTIPENQLPIKLVGYSACFRKEIGSHGIDEKGFFRVHQFHKVEMVVICKPEQSWKIHEEITKLSEEIYKKLGIPYRIVNICTGDLGVVAAKKYDLEAWMPRQQKYREVGSSSNCTDYQARRLNIRYGTAGAPQNPLVHTLNNTAIATSRAMVAILENMQQTDGSIKVPKPLHKYMNGIKVVKA